MKLRIWAMILTTCIASAVPIRGADAKPPSCASKPATIVGTSGPDEIDGTARADVIVGRGGDDRIRGHGGNDIVCGLAGWDIVRAGRGRDVVKGGKGDDFLEGGAAEDLLKGGDAVDVLFGHAGDDRLMTGSAPFPEVEDLIGGPGDDYLDGGGGADRAVFFAAPSGVKVNLRDETAAGDGSDELVRIEGAVGSFFDDSLAGDRASNILIGLDGNDTLRAGGSGSFISGADVLAGGAGNDLLDGEGGFDMVDFDRRLCFPVTVDLALGTATGQGEDALESVEGVFGSGCGDVLQGNDHDNAFWGGEGDDSLNGRGGSDTASYLFSRGPIIGDVSEGMARGEGAGVDGLISIENLWGSSFGDLLVGDAGENVLIGFSGRDALTGDDGDDLLDGGPEVDRLDGGGGVDTCVGEFTLGCENEGVAASNRALRRPFNPKWLWRRQP